MPMIRGWWELIGRRVEVTSGPLSGLSGALQDTHGDYGTVGYVDQQTRDLATFNALLRDMTPELEDGEELRMS